MDEIIVKDMGFKKYLFWGSNSKHIGYAYKEVDGYYVFIPSNSPSEWGKFWSGYALRSIANKLDELNKEWDEKIQIDMANFLNGEE